MSIKEKLRKTREIIKPVLLYILKFFGWIFLLIILCLLAGYNTYDNNISIGLVIFCYIFIIITYRGEIKSFKDWQQLAEKNEFYQKFCNQWQPHILGYLFVFWIGLKFCNNFEFIALILFSYCFNIWDRRYITHDIKHDMILKKLQENCQKD